MTTPSGQISVKDVETTINEGLSTNYPGASSLLKFGDSMVRNLAGLLSGPISMNDMRGKAGPTPYGTKLSYTCNGSTENPVIADGKYGSTAGTPVLNSSLCRAIITGGSATISSNQTNYTINVSTLSGYVAGKSDITITINSGIYVYATSTSNAGLTITGGSTGDTITLVNNGYIMGMGGQGGNVYFNGSVQAADSGTAGGPALSLGYSIYLTNNSFIGGGGGGGGAGVTQSVWQGPGGGGAGGGAGGTNYGTAAGTGGGPGSAGTNGPNGNRDGGGGGGRIMPGTGGSAGSSSTASNYGGSGGGAGGGGATAGAGGAGGAGGSGGSAGASASPSGSSAFGGGGGGGGWGAAGGNGSYNSNYVGNGQRNGTGGAGGKAIQLNSYSVTYNTVGTIYGAVS